MNSSATVLSVAEDKPKCGGQPQPKTKSYFKLIFNSYKNKVVE
jgi:hypothetical protein